MSEPYCYDVRGAGDHATVTPRVIPPQPTAKTIWFRTDATAAKAECRRHLVMRASHLRGTSGHLVCDRQHPEVRGPTGDIPSLTRAPYNRENGPSVVIYPIAP